MTLMYEITEQNWFYPVIGTDVVRFTVVDVDLSATDLFGAVSEENEENPGAYVHYNIDNDNGNTSNGQPIADKDEDGPVTGENDLKGATMGLVPSSLEHGSVVLKRSNAKTRVWKSATKGSANKVVVDSDEKTWDLSNETERSDFNSVKNSLYVEGYQNNGTSNLTVEYKDPNGDLVCSDTVKYTFIGAVCGDQPTPSQRQFFESGDIAPNLVPCEWSITHNVTTTAYNCIGWTVDETDTQWVKLDTVPESNIKGIDQEHGDDDGCFELEEDLDKFYADKKGYTPTASGAEDAVVMYYTGGGLHAAKKIGCGCGAGKWIMYESKCGPFERIEHVHDQLNGDHYGTPTRFYE